MRKLICCILLLAALAFGFTACGQEQQSESDTPSTQQSSNYIEFVQVELGLEIGESVQAEVITSRKNAPVFWSIRDMEIASVNNKGVITALAAGETVCYAEFGGETAMCLVKVSEKSAIPELSVSVPYYNNQMTIYSGRSLSLNVTVRLGAELISDAVIEYVVDDSQIAVVENGVVRAKAVGNTTVSVNVAYNGQTVNALVSVRVVDTVKTV